MVGREGRPWLAVAGLAVLLTSCEAAGPAGGQRQPVETDGSPTVITWLASSITQDKNDPRQVLIDAFEKEHPSITVNLISGPTSTDALQDTLRTRLASRTSPGIPDVYLGDLTWPAAFGHDRLALALSDRLGHDFWARFPTELVNGATYRGKTYGAPFFRDQGMLYYRADLLRQEGMPVPTAWEQLVGEATVLQARGLVKYGFVWQGAAYEGLTCVWTEVMSDAGGQVLDQTGTKSSIDSPQSLRALQFLRSLLTKGVTPLEVTNYQEPQVTEAFDSGQAAFARNWTSGYDAARTVGMNEVVGVAPLPTFADRTRPDSSTAGSSTVGGWNLYINPSTMHLKAALEFVRWMTDVEAQEIMAREYSFIPTNAAVLREPDLLAASPVFRAITRVTLILRPADTPVYPAVSKAIYTNVNLAIAGGQPPGDALRAARAQIDGALSGRSP